MRLLSLFLLFIITWNICVAKKRGTENVGIGDTLRGGYAITGDRSVRPAPIPATPTFGLASNHLPQPGSVYRRALRLPFLGKQVFRLSVLEENQGHLSIAGIMAVDATIGYNVCSDSGNVSFRLPEAVSKTLKKFRTKLIEAKYVPETDSVMIKVLPPLPKSVRIELRRVKPSETTDTDAVV